MRHYCSNKTIKFRQYIQNHQIYLQCGINEYNWVYRTRLGRTDVTIRPERFGIQICAKLFRSYLDQCYQFLAGRRRKKVVKVKQMTSPTEKYTSSFFDQDFQLNHVPLEEKYWHSKSPILIKNFLESSHFLYSVSNCHFDIYVRQLLFQH